MYNESKGSENKSLPKPQNFDCHVKSETLSESSNVDRTPRNTIKVPVVLSEPEVQICVESTIWLDKPALEIKRVLKDVFIDQCRLIATDIDHETNTVNRGKLFLFGHIRKNIEYAALDHEKHDGKHDCKHDDRHEGTCVHGNIRHNTVCVDFEACTPIDFTCSSFKPDLAPVAKKSFEFLDKDGHSPNLAIKQFHNEVFYNELPYCELVHARFDEIDFGFKKHHDHHGEHGHEERKENECDLDKTFQKVKEKIVLHVTVKLLQIQQVRIG
ncbi:hypothetical protein BVG16_05440 [Paenibacillus selenitireducens]|uniref:DUF7852 domain-containing protein n=1 Tax=Paenibacillus selenitireducens TaxID=1324314 RepID=A0A1T2XJZ2_9BACL|nr:hypothetical protein [Paenibacillus selenitireducens]OPA80189.1 hypothetical protein BVG16_05440 [Paenibacillus selenitireducens]